MIRVPSWNRVPRRVGLALWLGLGPALIAGGAAAQGPGRSSTNSSIGSSTVSQAAERDSLSVADCARIAAEMSPEVQIALLAHGVARFDSLSAAGNRRPTVALVGSALVAPSGFYDPAVTNLGEYELKVGLAVPLRDGGNAARERSRASNLAQDALRVLDGSRLAAARRAAELAIETLLLREKQRSQSAALAWLEDLGHILDARVRGGTSGPSDRMRVDLEQNVVRAVLESTSLDLRIATRELGQLLGLPPGVGALVRTPAPGERGGPTAADSLRLVAGIAHLPEVRAGVLAQARARLDEADATHRRDLRLSLTADAGLAGTDLTRIVTPEMRAEDPQAGLGTRLHRDLGASVGVGFERPLFDATIAPTIEARRAGTAVATREAALLTDTQTRDLLDLLDRWRSAERRLETARIMSEGAETNLLRVKSLYAGGATGILELLDARRILDDAQDQLAEARAQSRNARSEVETRP
jgi:outer membrane protein, heavy metal efflux system